MVNEKDLARELLKQNGIKSDRMSEDTRTELGRMIAKDKVRVRRLTRVTIVLWGLFAICFIAAAAYEGYFGGNAATNSAITRPYGAMLIVAAQGLLVISVICSIALYLRSMSARMRQIQGVLTNIEQQLSELAKKE